MHVRNTYHALQRQSRRNLSNDDIDFVVAHGRYIHCAGALHIFLGKRDIPADRETARRYSHLEGTVLILDATEAAPVLITAYRNRRGLKDIRTKRKYEHRTRQDTLVVSA